MKTAGAITLLKSNEIGTKPFGQAWAAGNKMGTVIIPSPTALVSVNNADANGFIKYKWDGTTPYVTPAGNVKYNTLIVNTDIEFTVAEPEIQYLEFDGTRTQVINNGYLTSLKGVIVNAGKSIIIEKGNKLQPSIGAYLAPGATVYKGGIFNYNGDTDVYFGTWSTDQIVKW